MSHLLDHPYLVFALAFIALRVAGDAGFALHARMRRLQESDRQDLGLALNAMLVLLGLVVGFTFAMATNRYEQRKTCEAEEANAIGTEYTRADLLPTTDAAKVRDLLKHYLDQRLLFYRIMDSSQLGRIDADTLKLQTDLWSAVRTAAAAQPTPLAALAVAGMNDVFNAQAYTQAAWWNRIPAAAWVFMLAMATLGNLLLGFIAHRTDSLLLWVLPTALSISFLMIADIDSPRSGLILLQPVNLVVLEKSMQ